MLSTLTNVIYKTSTRIEQIYISSVWKLRGRVGPRKASSSFPIPPTPSPLIYQLPCQGGTFIVVLFVSCYRVYYYHKRPSDLVKGNKI